MVIFQTYKKTKNWFQDQLLLNAGQSIAGAFCNAFDLHETGVVPRAWHCGIPQILPPMPL